MTDLIPELDMVLCVMEHLHDHPGEPWCRHCLVSEFYQPHWKPDKNTMSREVSLILRTLAHCADFDVPPEPCNACGGGLRTERIRLRTQRKK